MRAGTCSGASTPSAACVVPPDEPYELVLAPPAVRAVTADLPEAVAAAVVEFMTSVLVDNPHRIGKPLRADLAGIWSARRGTYRVLYRINDDAREVIVVRIEHRRDAYRTR
jgi:mRNA interferase RelE/StbE